MDLRRRHDEPPVRRLIPQLKHHRPMRFVGLGLLLMLAIIYLLYRFMVKP